MTDRLIKWDRVNKSRTRNEWSGHHHTEEMRIDSIAVLMDSGQRVEYEVNVRVSRILGDPSLLNSARIEVNSGEENFGWRLERTEAGHCMTLFDDLGSGKFEMMMRAVGDMYELMTDAVRVYRAEVS